jgi:hypothetical protein
LITTVGALLAGAVFCWIVWKAIEP